tara:strand:+ start:5360 stop:7468 length:2109 start_codon:yes stop_codon:yes gene_type:complete
MTINLADNNPRISYTVNAGATQTTFNVPFEFFVLADLNVYVDGVQKTATQDYTIASGGNGSTGTINLNVTGASGNSTVVITRDIAIERATDFQTSGPFAIDALNVELDKLVAIQADLKDKSTRSLQLTDFDAAASLTLPAVDTRKGKTLAFNASSGAVEAGPSIADVQTVSAASADIATLADIEDGTVATDAISNVNAVRANVTTVAGIASNVTSVANVASNVTAVAGNASNINTVAGNNSNISSVAGVSSLITSDFVSDLNTLATSAIVTDLDALADLATEIDALGDVTSSINTVAGISANVTTVAGVAANTTTVAGIASNVTTVAGIASNVTTVAGDSTDIATVAGISSNVSSVASNATNINAVAGGISNVNAVGGAISNVNTVASNISGVNSFAERYRVQSGVPSSNNDIGDLVFDTASNTLKVFGASGFQNAGSSVNGTSNRNTYTATANQTSFGATYDAGFVDVYLNGVKLIAGTDFTATNGSTVVLAAGAAAGDTVDIVAYGTFQVANISLATLTDVNPSGATNGQVLAFNSSSSDFEPTTLNVQAFPAGTLMLFQQTAAPTGWTKQTTHDNKALRVVTGSASSGGSSDFTTALGTPSLSGSTGNHTLTTANLAAHDHSLRGRNVNGPNNFSASTSAFGRADQDGRAYCHNTSPNNSFNNENVINNRGSNSAHNHTLSGTAAINVQYVDVIIAAKD